MWGCEDMWGWRSLDEVKTDAPNDRKTSQRDQGRAESARLRHDRPETRPGGDLPGGSILASPVGRVEVRDPTLRATDPTASGLANGSTRPTR